MCKADGDTFGHIGKVQGHGCQRKTAAHAHEGEYEHSSEENGRNVRHQPSDFIPSGQTYIRQHNLFVARAYPLKR